VAGLARVYLRPHRGQWPDVSTASRAPRWRSCSAPSPRCCRVPRRA